MNDKQAAYKYINEYQKKKYDRITILRKSGEKERLTRIASDLGYRTVTEFINACIDEKINALDKPETPAQASISPVETAEPEKPKYLPLTPENLQKIDFTSLKGNICYQIEISQRFGESAFKRLYNMTEAEFKKLAFPQES